MSFILYLFLVKSHRVSCSCKILYNICFHIHIRLKIIIFFWKKAMNEWIKKKLYKNIYFIELYTYIYNHHRLAFFFCIWFNVKKKSLNGIHILTLSDIAQKRYKRLCVLIYFYQSVSCVDIYYKGSMVNVRKLIMMILCYYCI